MHCRGENILCCTVTYIEIYPVTSQSTATAMIACSEQLMLVKKNTDTNATLPTLNAHPKNMLNIDHLYNNMPYLVFSIYVRRALWLLDNFFYDVLFASNVGFSLDDREVHNTTSTAHRVKERS